MTDIKEPNTTSDGTFLSVVCENPEKSVVGQKLGGCGPPSPPTNYPPVLYWTHSRCVDKVEESRKNSQSIMAFYKLFAATCLSLKGAQAIALSFNDEMVFNYGDCCRGIIIYDQFSTTAVTAIFFASTALQCSCPQTLSQRSSLVKGFAMRD